MTPEQIQQAIEGLLITTERTSVAVDKLTQDIQEQRQESKELGLHLESQRQDGKELGLKFGYYQQSTQAIINLAFSLIASATISVFITVVLKR